MAQARCLRVFPDKGRPLPCCRTAGSPVLTRTKGQGVGVGPWSRGPARVPPPGPGLYLHVTQLHAQIQLSVSLSPVNVRRQHLILHGHTAQGEMRLGSLRLATRWCAAGACRTQAANPRTPACQQPAASRRPTLAGRACAMTSGGDRAGSRI